MPSKVIILSTDKIRGAILYKAFEKDDYGPVLLNNAAAFKNAALSNPRAAVVLDAGTFFAGELKDFVNAAGLVQEGFLIIIDALEESKNAILRGIVGAIKFPHLPIDPEAVVHKAGEIFSARAGLSADAPLNIASPDDASLVGAAALAGDTRTRDSLTEDLKRFLNLR